MSGPGEVVEDLDVVQSMLVAAAEDAEDARLPDAAASVEEAIVVLRSVLVKLRRGWP